MYTDTSIIIDDSLFEQSEIDEIKKILLGEFPWYLGKGYTSTVLYDVYDLFKNHKNVFESGQFTHTFNMEEKITSDFFSVPSLISNKAMLKYRLSEQILRSKANLTTKVSVQGDNLHNTPHVDKNFPHWVMIYYVNNSDGDTFIFNETNFNCSNLTVKKRIEPKEGRVVIFDGKYLHAGMHPRNNNYRTVINFNLKK